MPRRVFRVLPVLFVGILCAAGIVFHIAGASPAERIILCSSAAYTLSPEASLELQYAYTPADTALAAFTVSSSDAAAASASAVRAENGILTVAVQLGTSGAAEIVVNSGGVTSAPCALSIDAPLAGASDGGEEETEKEPTETPAAAEGLPAYPEQVYVTETGQRWHVSQSCAGKNAYLIPFNEIGERTPCQRCASDWIESSQ